MDVSFQQRNFRKDDRKNRKHLHVVLYSVIKAENGNALHAHR